MNAVESQEEDLRLSVHATMQGTREALPLVPPEEVLALLRLRPLRLTGADVVDLKDQVLGQINQR